MDAVQSCLHSDATYLSHDTVPETVSVTCSQHCYQHDADDLALGRCFFLQSWFSNGELKAG